MRLSLSGLTVSINERDILKKVSLDFFPGITYLMGRNGSGKSTLLEAIAGLKPFKGKLFFNEASISQLKPREKAKIVAIVPQRAHWDQRLSVFDFMLMGRFPFLGTFGAYSANDEEVVNNWIDFLGMDAFTKRAVNTLSGGEFQKILIGRCLCQEASVILLDEPTQSLDPMGKEMLMTLLNRLSTDKIIICASHEKEWALQTGARLIGIKMGSLAYDAQTGPNAWAELKQSVFN